MQVINSKDVADMLEKRHDNLLRDIRKYVVSLGEEAVVSQGVRVEDYFYEGTYTDHLNKTRFCFMCTLKGCELMANRMIGEKSIKFKAQYSLKFDPAEAVTPAEPIAVQEPTEFPVDEVAKMLGISERSVYRNIQSGKLEAHNREVLTPITKAMVSLEAIERFKIAKEVQ